MKEKLFALIVLISIMLLSTIASATTVQTKINASNGSIKVNQTINGQIIEIETNESASIITNVTNSTVQYSVNVTGYGKLETNLPGENYTVTAIADDKTETHTGFGSFSAIFDFLRKILFSGWIRL